MSARQTLTIFIITLLIGLIIGNFFFPHDARSTKENLTTTIPLTTFNTSSNHSFTMIVTMYTSSKQQTDSTQCIAADGSDICKRWKKGENICASNDYAFGTQLFVGSPINKICVVRDRMAKGTKNHVDWYNGYDSACMENHKNKVRCPQLLEALQFGKRKLSIIVL